jgi:hypothetical protein
MSDSRPTRSTAAPVRERGSAGFAAIRLFCAGVLGCVLLALSAAGTANATEIKAELAARLTPAQQRTYLAYREARDAFERAHRTYWSKVNAKRDARRARRILAQDYAPDDYVLTQPPQYKGPELPTDIARIVAEMRPAGEAPEPLPGVDDFLRHAKEQFSFVPKVTTERDFKRRYAMEALRVGLTKDQVVRVYALETGGNGTYDTLSGINPVTRQGTPKSSALGYAQILHANSVGAAAKHGDEFAKRLLALAAVPGTPAGRATELRAKAAIMRKMMRVARSVPYEWSVHRRLASTAKGLGIHALNLDADVGPWLQTLKLRDLLEAAAKAGYARLTGAQLEIMNLAGPATGLEMMQPIGRHMPTSNFFSEDGYYRNSIVRERTAQELLLALEERMEANVKNAGSIEFAQVFDEVARRK